MAGEFLYQGLSNIASGIRKREEMDMLREDLKLRKEEQKLRMDDLKFQLEQRQLLADERIKSNEATKSIIEQFSKDSKPQGGTPESSFIDVMTRNANKEIAEDLSTLGVTPEDRPDLYQSLIMSDFTTPKAKVSAKEPESVGEKTLTGAFGEGFNDDIAKAIDDVKTLPEPLQKGDPSFIDLFKGYAGAGREESKAISKAKKSKKMVDTFITKESKKQVPRNMVGEGFNRYDANKPKREEFSKNLRERLLSEPLYVEKQADQTIDQGPDVIQYEGDTPSVEQMMSNVGIDQLPSEPQAQQPQRAIGVGSGVVSPDLEIESANRVVVPGTDGVAPISQPGYLGNVLSQTPNAHLIPKQKLEQISDTIDSYRGASDTDLLDRAIKMQQLDNSRQQFEINAKNAILKDEKARGQVAKVDKQNQEAALELMAKLPEIEQMRSIIEDGEAIGVFQGSKFMQWMGAVGDTLGIPNDYEDQNRLRIAISRGILDNAGALKGNLNEKEFETLSNTVPSLSSPQNVWRDYLNRLQEFTIDTLAINGVDVNQAFQLSEESPVGKKVGNYTIEEVR